MNKNDLLRLSSFLRGIASQLDENAEALEKLIQNDEEPPQATERRQ